MHTSINEIVSKPLRVEPLKQGQVAEFRLVGSGIVSPQTGKPAVSQGYIRQGRCRILDKYDNVNPEKEIYHVISTKTYREHGKSFTEPVIGSVIFGKGPLILDYTQNNTYMYLKLDNKNRDNKNRRPGSETIYYEYHEEKEAMSAAHRFEYKIMAGNLLLDLDTAQVLVIAARINEEPKYGFKIDLNKKIADIKVSLQTFTETNARDFVIYSQNKRGLAQISVDRLLDESLIVFDEAKKKWFWKQDKKLLAGIVKGNDPRKGLVDFLLSEEGSQDMAIVQSMHGDIYLTAG